MSTQLRNLNVEGLEVDLQAGVCKLTLNKPEKLNAIDMGIYRGIKDALIQAEKDDSIKVVLLTGKGKYFSSGNDLSMILSTPKIEKDFSIDSTNVFKDFIDVLIDFPKLFVVGVNGSAVGIAVTMLPLADFVYSSSNATFITPFTKLALIPEACSSYTFPKLMGSLKAKRLLIGSEKLTAEEAHSCGLVTGVVDAAKFDEVLMAKSKYLATLPRESVAISKKLIHWDERALLHEVNERESSKLAERWMSEECITSVMKLMTKGKKSKL